MREIFGLNRQITELNESRRINLSVLSITRKEIFNEFQIESGYSITLLYTLGDIFLRTQKARKGRKTIYS
jgi:hypothetical protein